MTVSCCDTGLHASVIDSLFQLTRTPENTGERGEATVTGIMFNNVNWQAIGPFAAAAAQAQATNMYTQVQQVGQAGMPMMPAMGMGMGMDQGMQQQQQQQQQMYQWYYNWQQQQQMPQQPQPSMMPQAVVSMAVLAALWC